MLGKNKLHFFVIGGALLIATLFLLMPQKIQPQKTDVLGQQMSEAPPLKPSQLDFVNSNLPAASSAQREPSEKSEKSKLIKKNEVWASGEMLTGEDAETWHVLRSVVESKNDNDPRLDKELKHMSEAVHKTIRDAYQKMAMEDRNERGTLVFLLTRDLKSSEDLQFLKSVYEEQACTSFESCNQVPSEDAHLSSIDEASLSYPQRAGLYQLASVVEKHPEYMRDPKFRDEIRAVIDSAANFPVPMVQKKAQELRARLFPNGKFL